MHFLHGRMVSTFNMCQKIELNQQEIDSLLAQLIKIDIGSIVVMVTERKYNVII